MGIPGTWEWHFSWGCDGSYLTTTVTLKADGTYTEAGGASGHWAAFAGYFMLNFNGAPGGYSGTIIGSSGHGMQTNFSGSNGCWYAVQTSAKAVAATKGEKGHKAFTGS
jgi:hypothetical protein